MKKHSALVFMVIVLVVASTIGTHAFAEDSWAYPENVLAFLFRLGIVCREGGAMISEDPFAEVDGDDGYFVIYIDELQVLARYDIHTLKISRIMFPMDNENYDAQRLTLAAFCEEAAVTSRAAITKDLHDGGLNLLIDAE